MHTPIKKHNKKIVKRLGHLTKKDTQMANKCMKRYIASLVIKEMQIETK